MREYRYQANDYLNKYKLKSLESVLRVEIESYKRLLGELSYQDVKEGFHENRSAIWRISSSLEVEEWGHKE